MGTHLTREGSGGLCGPLPGTDGPWPSPPGAVGCSPSCSHTSSFSSYSSSMLWEGSVLFLVLFACNRNTHVPALFRISLQKRILFHSTPFLFILCFCHQTLQASGVVPFLKTCQLCWAIQRRRYVTVTWDLVTASVPAVGLQVAWDKMASVLTLPACKMGHPAYSPASK